MELKAQHPDTIFISRRKERELGRTESAHLRIGESG